MQNLNNGTKGTKRIPRDDFCIFKRRLEIRLQIKLFRISHGESLNCIIT